MTVLAITLSGDSHCFPERRPLTNGQNHVLSLSAPSSSMTQEMKLGWTGRSVLLSACMTPLPHRRPIALSISYHCEKPLKVARDSCDVTHSLKQASIHTSHVHASRSCTKYTHCKSHCTVTSCNQPAHTNVIMLYAVKCSLYVVCPFYAGHCIKVSRQGVKM